MDNSDNRDSEGKLGENRPSDLHRGTHPRIHASGDDGLPSSLKEEPTIGSDEDNQSLASYLDDLNRVLAPFHLELIPSFGLNPGASEVLECGRGDLEFVLDNWDYISGDDALFEATFYVPGSWHRHPRLELLSLCGGVDLSPGDDGDYDRLLRMIPGRMPVPSDSEIVRQGRAAMAPLVRRILGVESRANEICGVCEDFSARG